MLLQILKLQSGVILAMMKFMCSKFPLVCDFKNNLSYLGYMYICMKIYYDIYNLDFLEHILCG